MVTKYKESPAQEPKKIVAECNHYWKIEMPDGPSSKAVCRRCGTKKEFMNSFPDYSALKKGERVFSLPDGKKITIKTGPKEGKPGKEKVS